MKTSDVMQLIDLIADLESPAAGALRAFSDRALLQVETPELRVGVVTSEGRPVDAVLAAVDELGVKRDVWSLEARERPSGADAWILVVSGDQADFAEERRFLSRIGRSERAVVATGFEHLSPEVAVARREKVIRAFDDLGRGRFCFGTADLATLRRTLEDWRGRCDALRSAVLAEQAEPLLSAVADDQTSVDDRLHRLPDVAEAERALEAFRGRWSAATEALGTAAGEIGAQMREEVEQRWSEWVSTVTANHGEEINRERVQSSLEKWLADRFASRFAERLEHRLRTHTEHLPQLARAIHGIRASQTVDFSAPAVELPPEAPSRLRWLLPVAGGGAGWWRGGPRMALIGAALGLVIARLLRRSLTDRPLEDGRLIDGAADHLSSHLDLLAQRAAKGLDTECALEADRLKQAVVAANRAVPERKKLIATLEQLAKARSLLAGASQPDR